MKTEQNTTLFENLAVLAERLQDAETEAEKAELKADLEAFRAEKGKSPKALAKELRGRAEETSETASVAEENREEWQSHFDETAEADGDEPVLVDELFSSARAHDKS